jgi:PAS domain S-box-containing protein
VDDSAEDAELLTRVLRRAGLEPECRRVDNRADMSAALGEQTWDIVIADYSMPQFSGTAALALLRERDADTPFIFVSGTIGEETAVAALRSGAQDYVLKGNLARLAPAVERELRDAELRRERRRAEEKLKRSEARYRELFENAPVALYRTLPSGEILDANGALVKLLGYPSREAMLRHSAVEHYVDPAERLRWVERLGQSGVAVDFETRLRRVDGVEVVVENSGKVVRDSEGRVLYIEGSLVDITERRRAERELRATKERLSHVVAASSAVIYVLDARSEELALTWVSENIISILGWARDEVVSRGWWADQVHPEDRERARAERGSVLSADRVGQEYRLRRKDGSYRWVLDESRLVRDAAGAPEEVIGAWLDVTEKKSLEAQLQQSQKMEAIGRLAGGIAHDFNNLLTAIRGYADLLREQIREGDPRRADVDEIRRAADRAAGLTRQLLTFSRRQVLQPRILDLNEVIAAMDRMLRRIIGEDVELVAVSFPGLWPVKADPGQIEQVVVNLAVNARDAMPRGGRLTIETANVELDEGYQATHGFAVEPGRYVMLAVTDTGTGMTQEVQARIFEPFFTTKEPGKGTGLGLATAYGIVKQSGGHITVYSELGRGSTFKLYLPQAPPEAQASVARAAPEGLTEGTETVLLVEDDAAVRRLARQILERLGYSVLEARSPADALDMAGRAGPIHLVVTDVVMPGMSGRELADRVGRLRPGVKILYTSGYPGEAIARQGVLETGTEFLPKPFTANGLAQKVRQVLDGKVGERG